MNRPYVIIHTHTSIDGNPDIGPLYVVNDQLIGFSVPADAMRNEPGVLPVSFLKTLLKYVGYS